MAKCYRLRRSKQRQFLPGIYATEQVGKWKKITAIVARQRGKTSSASYGLLGVSCVIIDHSV